MKQKKKTGADKKVPISSKEKSNSIKNNSASNLKRYQAEFINSVSHQLRTPLSTLQSSFDLFEYYLDHENNARRDELLLRMKRTIKYLNEIMENVTMLYKYSIPRQKLAYRKIDLHRHLNDLLQEIAVNMSDLHYLTININPGSEYIICDEFVLNQILGNLISNAVKFSPFGGQIRLDINKKEKTIEISLKDEGIGILKSDMKKIFSPFMRGKNSASIPGVGMGLAIVKKMVELLDGKISCKSSQDKGSEFIIRLQQKVSDEKDIINRR